MVGREGKLSLPAEFLRRLTEVHIVERPFPNLEIAPEKGRATTRQVGRFGERVAQQWLLEHFGVESNPATISGSAIGTLTVDLYDRTARWAYEVKTGRVGLGRLKGQAHTLATFANIGAIAGASFISVQYGGVSGFTRSATAYLRKQGFGVFTIYDDSPNLRNLGARPTASSHIGSGSERKRDKIR